MITGKPQSRRRGDTVRVPFRVLLLIAGGHHGISAGTPPTEAILRQPSAGIGVDFLEILLAGTADQHWQPQPDFLEGLTGDRQRNIAVGLDFLGRDQDFIPVLGKAGFSDAALLRVPRGRMTDRTATAKRDQRFAAFFISCRGNSHARRPARAIATKTMQGRIPPTHQLRSRQMRETSSSPHNRSNRCNTHSTILRFVRVVCPRRQRDGYCPIRNMPSSCLS